MKFKDVDSKNFYEKPKFKHCFTALMLYNSTTNNIFNAFINCLIIF